MSITCPVCQTEYSQNPPNFCTICGWILSETSEDLKSAKKIEWAKRYWARNQAAEMRAMQGQSAVVDRENQIEDLESRIDLLQRRLERLTLEKEQDLEAARQQERERIAQETIRPLEVEIAQLKQLLQKAEATSQELQIELQNQLDDRQRQMELWQRRLSQVTAEKDQALEIARQQELERVGQLEAEVRKLQGRLQVAQSGNEQLEANLQKQQIQNDRQRQALQAQLQEAHELVKHLTQREHSKMTST